MTVELWAMAWTAILLLVLAIVSATGGTAVMGPEWAFGNRDAPPTTVGWVARSARAHRNLIENLPPFTAIVVAAHLAGVHTEYTVLGAEIFLAARVAHAIFYSTGVTFLALRTLVHFASIGGTITIFWQLVSHGMR